MTTKRPVEMYLKQVDKLNLRQRDAERADEEPEEKTRLPDFS